MNLTIAKILHLLLLAAFVAWSGSSVFFISTVGDPEFGSWTDHFFRAWPALCVQPLYPVLHLATAKLHWTRPWRMARGLHLTAVIIVLLGFGILVLSTPDVSGFTS